MPESQQPTVRNPIAVSLGAIAGALSRYYLSLWFAIRFGMGFPYGIFINVTGCLVMRFFFTLALDQIASISSERLLVAVGFLGSYTTFSRYALDTLTLLHNGFLLKSGLYCIGSAILGLISLQVKISLARLGK